MISLPTRRFVTGPFFRVAVLAIGFMTGEVGAAGGSEFSTKPSNARLWLARARDVRRREVKLMAERLGTDRWQLCLLGADVRIETAPDGQSLFAPSTAMIGSLTAQGNSVDIVVCDGPG